MRLRLQLILIGLVTLILPWAGCTYLKDMENVLRENQQKMVLATAQSVGKTLENTPDVQQVLRQEKDGPAPVYLTEIRETIETDGYLEAYQPKAAIPSQHEGFSASYSLVANEKTAWLVLRVITDSIVPYNPTLPGLINGDHIILRIRKLNTNAFVIPVDAPGKIAVRKRSRDNIVFETRMKGALNITPLGYEVELEFPRSMLGDLFSIDITSDGRTITSKDNENRMGRLIAQDENLNRTLSEFNRDDMRLMIVDGSGRILAKVGTASFRPAEEQDLPPGGWLIGYLYRLIMPDELAVNRLPASSDDHTMRPEIARARDTQQATTEWYASSGDTPGAVISAAVPLGYSWVNGGTDAVLVAEQTTDQLLAVTNTAMLRMITTSFGAVFIIVILLLGYASFLSMRIQKLNKSINEAVLPDGTIVGSVERPWGNDEIAKLGSRFGTLLNRVQEYTDYLESLAGKLSHEMRTPLAMIGGSLDNFADQPDQKYLDRAKDGAKRLSRILTALNEAKGVEQAIAANDTEQINLNKLIEGYADSFRSTHPEYNIHCRTPESETIIEGSDDLLAQLLDKLLENALDFCPEGGNIRLSLDTGNGQATLTVSNDGPLLPDSMAGQLFDSMVSIRTAKTESPHLGLGLTIVRLVAEFHGGNATAENLSDGSGVVFTVDLPLT